MAEGGGWGWRRDKEREGEGQREKGREKERETYTQRLCSTAILPSGAEPKDSIKRPCVCVGGGEEGIHQKARETPSVMTSFKFIIRAAFSTT